MRRRQRVVGVFWIRRRVEGQARDGAVAGAHQEAQVDVPGHVEEVDGVVNTARRCKRGRSSDALDGSSVDGDVEGAAELGGLFFLLS